MSTSDHRGRTSTVPVLVARITAAVFLATGVFAMVAPQAFFDAVATFEPYNQHFLQDIGAFNIGLGGVLLLAARPGADALVAALSGAALGAAAHVVSHLLGLDAGGTPALDVPLFSATALILGVAAWVRARDLRSAQRLVS